MFADNKDMEAKHLEIDKTAPTKAKFQVWCGGHEEEGSMGFGWNSKLRIS